MKVLLTGHDGYIGAVMTRFLTRAGHDVTGLDTYFYEDCSFGSESRGIPVLRKDIREIEVEDLRGYDAVIHLAALSNDPLGCLDEQCTLDINYLGSVRLARAAKTAGVARFLFASSCSLYGAAGDDMLAEDAAFNPITAYGRSKVLVEGDVSRMADAAFSPVFLRNATAYGVSPRLRADVVVNNLVGVAYTTGEVVVHSDGTPWRPLVHVDDISRAFLAVLHAPRAVIHNQAFNVGSTKENYRVRDIVDMVREVVPGSRVRYLEGGGPDPRCYRVNCDKLWKAVPGFKTEWTVRRGVEDLYEAYHRRSLTTEMFSRYFRLACIQAGLQSGRLDSTLRWQNAAAAAALHATAVGRPTASFGL